MTTVDVPAPGRLDRRSRPLPEWPTFLDRKAYGRRDHLGVRFTMGTARHGARAVFGTAHGAGKDGREPRLLLLREHHLRQRAAVGLLGERVVGVDDAGAAAHGIDGHLEQV